VAFDETWIKLRPELTTLQLGEIDSLLEFDESLGATPLVWLCQQPSAPAAAEMVREQLVKLERLRQLGIATGTVATLPANRVRHFARLGQRHTPQALRRFNPNVAIRSSPAPLPTSQPLSPTKYSSYSTQPTPSPLSVGTPT